MYLPSSSFVPPDSKVGTLPLSPWDRMGDPTWNDEYGQRHYVGALGFRPQFGIAANDPRVSLQPAADNPWAGMVNNAKQGEGAKADNVPAGHPARGFHDGFGFDAGLPARPQGWEFPGDPQIPVRLPAQPQPMGGGGPALPADLGAGLAGMVGQPGMFSPFAHALGTGLWDLPWEAPGLTGGTGGLGGR